MRGKEPDVKVRIDPDLCTGHGRCYSVAPAVFEPDDQGYGVVILDEITPEQRDQAELGVRNCPEQAISVIEV